MVLGMHRSGTSALARGLQMLGVYLGNDFLSPQPDNPTGYWEDRNIFEINERLLAVFGLKWEDVALIDDVRWHESSGGITACRGRSIPQIGICQSFAVGFQGPAYYSAVTFLAFGITPSEVDECYLVVIRNPRSVANSLLQRQVMDAVTAHLLWLVYVVPYLSLIADRPFIVADYDLVMADPCQELERIARGLNIPLDDTSKDRDRRVRRAIFSIRTCATASSTCPTLN